MEKTPEQLLALRTYSRNYMRKKRHEYGLLYLQGKIEYEQIPKAYRCFRKFGR